MNIKQLRYVVAADIFLCRLALLLSDHRHRHPAKRRDSADNQIWLNLR